MGELDFRKKRKNTNIRGTARKQGKNSRQRELRFENEKREKRSSGKRWGKNKKNTKGIVLWAVELLLVCMTAVFLVAAFGQIIPKEVLELPKYDVACFKKRKCCDDKSLYL